jgi:hypothetical protein
MGRDVITIASALVPNGCDVIASLPKAITPPILDTPYSILSLPFLCSTRPLGLRASSLALSAPRKLPHPGFQTQDREERIGGVDFTAGVGFEQGDDAFTGKESGGVEAAGAG